MLLLSGYDAVSHRYWHNILGEHLRGIDWTVVALPDRHFYWRARGNGLTYAFSHAQDLTGPFDLIVATSMVDICNLRGFLPHLASIPTIVYFHENQFSYPVKPGGAVPRSNIVNAQLTSIYSALCADKIVFNSRYNKDTFYSGARALLKKMPDGINRNLLNKPEEISLVLPVPVSNDPQPGINQLVEAETNSRDKGPVQIVWNHRWEYDKQPEVFFDAMAKLQDAGYDFRLHVMGQSFREIPECFAKAKTTLQNKISTWGHQPSAEYNQLLRQADIVVSTALHDFQGLSLLEAIHRGCVPVAPNRVAYPEYIPAELLYDTGSDEADSLYSKLAPLMEGPIPAAPDVSNYSVKNLSGEYEYLFQSVASIQTKKL